MYVIFVHRISTDRNLGWFLILSFHIYILCTIDLRIEHFPFIFNVLSLNYYFVVDSIIYNFDRFQLFWVLFNWSFEAHYAIPLSILFSKVSLKANTHNRVMFFLGLEMLCGLRSNQKNQQNKHTKRIEAAITRKETIGIIV